MNDTTVFLLIITNVVTLVICIYQQKLITQYKQEIIDQWTNLGDMATWIADVTVKQGVEFVKVFNDDDMTWRLVAKKIKEDK